MTCVVADEHPPIIDSVSRLLAEQVAVVETATEAEAAVAAVEQQRPTLCITGVGVTRPEGTELVRRMHAASPETALIVFADSAETGLGADWLEAGARGIALKSAPLAALVRAVDVVTHGGVYIDAELGGVLVTREAGAQGPLTSREREVLRLFAEGNSYAEAGKLLSVSTDTVRTHTRRAMSRLGARNKTHAVALAIRRGLIR